MLFKNCRELPIHNFNEIVEGDFSYLIKSGEPTEEEIQERWLEILDEYQDLSNDGAMNPTLKKKAEIISLQLRIQSIAIKTMIDPENNPKGDKIVAGLQNNLERKIRELPKNEGKSNFDKTLAILNMNGFSIDRFRTPVSEYLKMLEVLDEKAKANRKKT